jgi:hypothetical protein
MKKQMHELTTITDLVDFIQTNKVEMITSFGDTGIYIDSELNEQFHSGSINKLADELNDKNIQHDIVWNDENQDEWTIQFYSE